MRTKVLVVTFVALLASKPHQINAQDSTQILHSKLHAGFKVGLNLPFGKDLNYRKNPLTPVSPVVGSYTEYGPFGNGNLSLGLSGIFTKQTNYWSDGGVMLLNPKRERLEALMTVSDLMQLTLYGHYVYKNVGFMLGIGTNNTINQRVLGEFNGEFSELKVNQVKNYEETINQIFITSGFEYPCSSNFIAYFDYQYFMGDSFMVLDRGFLYRNNVSFGIKIKIR